MYTINDESINTHDNLNAFEAFSTDEISKIL